MAYERKDYYYRKAKSEGKASRAAYKLLQLQERFRFIPKHGIVIDLGCFPGGWLQELSEMVGPEGRVVGIDLTPLEIPLPRNVLFLQGDAHDVSIQDQLLKHCGREADALVCDMAPKTSGIPFADSYRSYELALCGFESCSLLLKPGGHFLVKIFQGEEVKKFLVLLRQHFEKVDIVTPPATRKTSSEIYVMCRGHNKTR